MNVDDVQVKILTEYTPEVARELGKLTPFLSKSGTGEPVPEAQLRKILASNDHVQFVAWLNGHIVGTATVVAIRGILREKAYLHEIVTDETVRGKGVGHKLWLAIEQWCREQGLVMMDFTSGADREAAHEFYRKHGAEVRDTLPFRMVFNDKEGK